MSCGLCRFGRELRRLTSRRSIFFGGAQLPIEELATQHIGGADVIRVFGNRQFGRQKLVYIRRLLGLLRPVEWDLYGLFAFGTFDLFAGISIIGAYSLVAMRTIEVNHNAAPLPNCSSNRLPSQASTTFSPLVNRATLSPL